MNVGIFLYKTKEPEQQKNLIYAALCGLNINNDIIITSGTMDSIASTIAYGMGFHVHFIVGGKSIVAGNHFSSKEIQNDPCSALINKSDLLIIILSSSKDNQNRENITHFFSENHTYKPIIYIF